jgi:hypothetical protein
MQRSSWLARIASVYVHRCIVLTCVAAVLVLRLLSTPSPRAPFQPTPFLCPSPLTSNGEQQPEQREQRCRQE